MGRMNQGFPFEMEWSQSLQMAMDWASDQDLRVPLVRFAKIGDTGHAVRGRCGRCGQPPRFCPDCGGKVQDSQYRALRAEGDWRIYWRGEIEMVIVEAKSSKRAGSFPLDNIREEQLETCMLLENLKHVEYWWAINDRRHAGSFRCWMVRGADALEWCQAQNHRTITKGQDPSNGIKWQSFDYGVLERPNDVLRVPRTFGSKWDLTQWLLRFVLGGDGCSGGDGADPRSPGEFPRISEDYVRRYIGKYQEADAELEEVLI